MSDVKTSTFWRCVDSRWIDTDPDCDCMALTMQANGKAYGVVVSGPKGMRSDEFVPALQAATAALIVACGGDPTTVGAAVAGGQGDLFDTGDQRAN